MARSALLNVMVTAAFKAGRSLSRDFGEIENLQVSVKGPGDFVTSADLKAEKIIRVELEQARPKFGFLMEEAGAISGSDPQNRWIVDPLDGTINFMHGLPHFCISIALEREKEIVAGVVYNPATDELFTAERGRGAYCNDKRLRVSARRDMTQALISTWIPRHGQKGHGLALLEQQAIMRASSGVRCFGATALDLSYVAAGRVDGIWQRVGEAWDFAAGTLIVREAGGFVTDLYGSNNGMSDSHSILAANEHLHSQLAKAIGEVKTA